MNNLLHTGSGAIEAALRQALTREVANAPPKLAEAVQYAVFPGGARIRPRLCVAVADACGRGTLTKALSAAVPIEFLHCGSLVHDDMPCFDDADRRRGRPSVHAAYGEATALLVGDALITSAFSAAANGDFGDDGLALFAVRTLGVAAGPSRGLIAGQAWECESHATIERVHAAKTGALFRAACMMGAAVGGGDPSDFLAMGDLMGSIYQVADDLADALASSEQTGKPSGQDARFDRPSLVRETGIEEARAHLHRLMDDLVQAIPPCRGARDLRGTVLELLAPIVTLSGSHPRKMAASS